MRGRLPSVNSASDAVGGSASRANDAVAAYIRQGLDLASHRVFHALAGIAVLGVAAVLAAPRRYTRLRFDDDPADPDDDAADPGPRTPPGGG
jgi:hypothetical protein